MSINNWKLVNSWFDGLNADNLESASELSSPSVTQNGLATVTGTATENISESDIVDGGKTIVITLTFDTWKSDIGENNGNTQGILDGIDGDVVGGTGWDNEIKAQLDYTMLTRTSDTVVTIVLPSAPDYDITAGENVTVTVPPGGVTSVKAPFMAGSLIVVANKIDIGAENVESDSEISSPIIHTKKQEAGSWAFYNDGTEASAAIIGISRQDPSLSVETIYHYRQVFEAIGDHVWTDPTITLQYNLNNTAWYDVTAGGDVVRSARSVSGLIEDGQTTARLAGTGTFIACAGQDEENGWISDTISLDNQYSNAVFAFIITGAGVLNTDTLSFRLFDADAGIPLDNYQYANPDITIVTPPELLADNLEAASELSSPYIYNRIYDDFSSDLSAWTEGYGTGFSIVGGQLLPATAQTDFTSSLIYTAYKPETDNQWVSVNIGDVGTVYWAGVSLRWTNGTAYSVQINNTTIRIRKIIPDAAYVPITEITLDSVWVSGDKLGVSVEGTGLDTWFHIWINPVGATPNDWGLPDYEFNHANDLAYILVDSGDYVGTSNWNLVNSPDNPWKDNFEGGSLEGTDRLIPNDLQSVSEVSSATIAQENHLLASDLDSVSEVSSITIGNTNVLLADDLESASNVSSPIMVQGGIPSINSWEVISSWFGDTLAQNLHTRSFECASEIEIPTLRQVNNDLLADDLEASSELSSPVINLDTANAWYPNIWYSHPWHGHPWHNAVTLSQTLLADNLESTSEVGSVVVQQNETVLLADDLESTSEVLSVSISQEYSIIADDLESTVELSSPNITVTGANTLLSTNLECSSEVRYVLLAQTHNLLANDLEATSEIKPTRVGLGQALFAANLEAASALSTPYVGKYNYLLSANLECISEISSPLLLHKPIITKTYDMDLFVTKQIELTLNM